MSAKGLSASLAILAVMAALSIWGWTGTPADAEIAVHWTASGEADRYGGKPEAFLLLPAIGVALSAVFAVGPWIDPRGRNLKASGPAYLTVWLGALAVLACAHLVVVLTAVGVLAPSSTLTPRLILGGVCILIVAVGNVLGKARPNWFLGVRTPWTLSSDKAWDVTHRWAGRGFVLSGLAGAGGLVLGSPETGLTLLLALLAVTAVGALALSYMVWRRDPLRETFNERE